MENKLLRMIPQNNDCDFERIARLQDYMYHRKVADKHLLAERRNSEAEAVLRKAD